MLYSSPPANTALFLPLLSLLSAAGCASPRPAPPRAPVAATAPAPKINPPESPPTRLSRDVTPTHYSLSFDIDPARDRFSGITEIEVHLDKARDSIWIHGRALDIKEVTVHSGGTPINGQWIQEASRTPEDNKPPVEVAAIRLPVPVGPGDVKIRISYEAPFDKQLEGLYRVSQAGRNYAFTQFESIFARRAFPCFDEPGWKTPFDLAVTVPDGNSAIANTREKDRSPVDGGRVRVRFDTTLPLPTYLVAIAVGPLDIVPAKDIPPNEVRKTPLPLRGVSAAGHGPQLAYALSHTPAIVEALERYFGIPYPYDKLDLIAVPDFEAGAMENAGAVTFRDWLLLVDEKSAPVDQLRAFEAVTAHELAHQWFGDLVTMQWWDDVWLNEAFASWMGTRIVQTVRPEDDARVEELQAIHRAMGFDALASARAIRQPIITDRDISNAFDSLTYNKGSAVLSMFERWMGPEKFQRGIHAYLELHRFKNATADDLLAALSQSAGKDVTTPFRTFLDQPGVPRVSATLECGSGATPLLKLHQERFVPLGSTAERNRKWQIPICARYGEKGQAHETCALLSDTDGTLPLEGGCPDWVLPNADGAGYYRFALGAPDLENLRNKGFAALSVREQMSFSDGLDAAFSAGTIEFDALIAGLSSVAKVERRPVAVEPMGSLRFFRDHLVDDRSRPGFERLAQRLYAHDLAWTGFIGKAAGAPDHANPSEMKLFGGDVINFLSFIARQPAVRARAAKLGREFIGFGKDDQIHSSVVEPELATAAIATALEESGMPYLEKLIALLKKSEDPLTRSRIVQALGLVHAPDLAERVRALILDPALRTNERPRILDRLMRENETREATWEWIKTNFPTLTEKLSDQYLGGLPTPTEAFCDTAHAADVRSFFADRVGRFAGGPRNLDHAVEQINLCAARVAKYKAAADRQFGAAK